MSKVFVIDVNRCNGCHNCQIVCKDEHCGQAWMPYAQAQPLTGQFWCSVEERERGQVPATRIAYIPHLGAQCDELAEYAPEVLQERVDGLVVIDPEKAAGRKDLAEKFDGVFWNDELQIPQGCTGCAHLLDNGWSEPRCVDACPTEALRFVEADEIDLSQAACLEGCTGHVFYLNLPKRFVAGLVFDPEVNEVVIGATAKLMLDGEQVAECTTDDFGDFRFDQVEPAVYTVVLNAPGFAELRVVADVTEGDLYVGDQAMEFVDDRKCYPSAADLGRLARAEAVVKWVEMRRGTVIDVDENDIKFTVVCPACGKSFGTSLHSDMIQRCSACRADLTEAIKQQAAELLAKHAAQKG